MPCCISSSLLSFCSPTIYCPARDLLLPVILGPDSVSEQATLLWTRSRFLLSSQADTHLYTAYWLRSDLEKLNEEGQQEEISLKRRSQRKPANIITTVRLGNRVPKSTKEKSGSHKDSCSLLAWGFLDPSLLLDPKSSWVNFITKEQFLQIFPGLGQYACTFLEFNFSFFFLYFWYGSQQFDKLTVLLKLLFVM